MNSIAIALEMAQNQLDQGWIEVDEDQYDSVQARLDIVNKLIRDAQKSLDRMEK